MKCSRCGREIQQGHLYCESCGQEIRIVPDLDIEVENSIHETLSTLVESMTEGEEETKKRQKRKKWHGLKIFLPLVCFLVIAGILYAGSVAYHRNSFDYQMKKATAFAQKREYGQAVEYLNRAVSLNPDDMEVRLRLADYYTKAGDTETAKQVLRDVLAMDGENEECYQSLIALYEEEKNYEAINRLLQNSDSTQIQSQFRRYLALEPEFSNAEGSYTEVVVLKLSANTTGNIYYTLDGSVPTAASERYTTPIMLESGAYDISAVFINEFGISSKVVKKHYNIEVAVPLAPIVNCISGSYDRPTMILAEAPEGCSIYYTLDGSVPTMDSIPYSVPIAMPLGRSTFRFIAYSSEGIASEVTTRNYKLQVETAINPEDAVNLLLQELKSRGVILEFDGSVPGKSGKNVYIASTLIQIGQNYFYLVAEYYQDTIGTLTLTGSLYGVEADSGMIYRVTTDSKGNYLANPY